MYIIMCLKGAIQRNQKRMAKSGQYTAFVKCVTRRFLRLHRLFVDHLQNKKIFQKYFHCIQLVI